MTDMLIRDLHDGIAWPSTRASHRGSRAGRGRARFDWRVDPLVLAAPATSAGDSAWFGFGLGVRGGAAGGVAAGAGVGLVELVAADS
jgi:hypothetical protein